MGQNQKKNDIETNLMLDQVYKISKDVVVREIHGELIIVPIASGVGDMEDELYSMNETGKAILKSLDGEKSLHQIVLTLSSSYDASYEQIKKDIFGIVNELIKRRIVQKVGQRPTIDI